MENAGKCACREAIRLPEAEGRAPKGPQGAALFRRAPCRASALSSPRSAIFRLASEASPSHLHGNLRAVSLVSRHFPPLHGALSSSPAALAALCVASALTADVIRHVICGGLHRAAARRIAIHPHLPGRMPSAERRLRRLPRLRLASLHAGDRALCAVIACQRFAFQRNAVQCLAIHFHCTMKKECAMKVFQVRIALKILSMQNSFAQGKVRRTDIALSRA